MNRLAVLLAVAALGGSGCVTHNGDCSRTVSVGWPSFLDVHRNPATCGSVSTRVTDVEVFVDDRSVGTFACSTGSSAGVDVTGVRGNHTITVEGLDAHGNVIVRDWFSSGDTCSDQLVNTQPAEGTVALEYDFYNSGVPYTGNQDVCASSDSRLWLQVTDLIANVPAYRYDASAPSVPPCESSQRTLSLPLAAGDYRLDWMQERDYTRAQALTAAACSALPFSVDPGATTTKRVALDVTCH